MAEERVELERLSSPGEAPLARPGYPAAYGYPEAYGYGDAQAGGGLDFRGLWRLIRKRKLLILAIVAIVTTAVVIEMYRTKSTYKATALVEVAQDNRAVIKSLDVVVQDQSDTQVPTVAMETKILILKSRPLLEDVVVGLKLDQNPKFLDVTERKSLLDAVKTIGRKFGLATRDNTKPAPAGGETQFELDEKSERSPAESERLAKYVGALKSNLSIEQVRNTRASLIRTPTRSSLPRLLTAW